MDPSLEAQLQQFRDTDILIGCPAYNSASTIRAVLRGVVEGLNRYFPGVKAVVVVSDGGSTDTTLEEVRRAQAESECPVISLSHPVRLVHEMAPPFHGVPGKEMAFRNFFEALPLLGAKVCGLVDSDLNSRTPEWVKSLIDPVLAGDFDFVGPIYGRHKFDGSITNMLVYPLTRALYRKQMRQLLGGDFGVSQKLAAFYLNQPVWESDIARFAPDIWMTTLAIVEGFKVCQSFLGPKVYVPKDYPESDFGSMFTQVVSSVFGLMEIFESVWKGAVGSEPVVTFGPAYQLGADSAPSHVSSMIRHFQLGAWNLMDVWSKALSPETLRALQALSRIPKEAFFFPDDLWVSVVYDSAIAYHLASVHRDHLLRSLIPIYLGKTASFIKENRESPAKEVEEKIESLCTVYEERKDDLLARWDGRKGQMSGGGE